MKFNKNENIFKLRMVYHYNKLDLFQKKKLDLFQPTFLKGLLKSAKTITKGSIWLEEWKSKRMEN